MASENPLELPAKTRRAQIRELVRKDIPLAFVVYVLECPQRTPGLERLPDNSHTRSLTKCGAVSAAAAILAGCGGGHMQLDKLRESKVPVWYLGSSFEGNELTYADFDGVPERVLVVYGDCDPPGGFFSDGGCVPPLELTTCAGSDTIVIYGDGHGLDRRAAKALRPLNGAAQRVGKPYVQFGYGTC
jgi:hypothetical protein